jgi:hypothetical protein
MYTNKLLPILIAGVLTSIMGCGGDSPSTPTPTATPTPTVTATPAPTPAPPADAVVTLTGSYRCLDPFCDFAAFNLTLRNTGGVGANLNFIRVENQNGQPILELGADHFINTFGDNRLEADQTLDFVLTAQLGYVVIVGYGDDNGNTGQAKYFP